jgi:hypothetical protein
VDVLARGSIGKPDEIAYYLACAPLEAHRRRPGSYRWMSLEDRGAQRTSAAWNSTRPVATVDKLDPDYQRRHRWSVDQKSRLLYRIFPKLGITSPAQLAGVVRPG